MCDNLAKNITLSNVASVAPVTNDISDCLTSVGITDPIDDTGFGVASVKMSKNTTVIATGSFNFDIENPNRATNRPGLNIYLKKAGITNTCSKMQESWQHYQTILFDDDEFLLQITRVAVSDDGSSIVALGFFDEGEKIWVFEEINRCTPQAKWILQQTLTNSDSSVTWNAIALDDKHKRMVVRQFHNGSGSENDENIFCIFDRQRPQKKCSNSSEDTNGFKFTKSSQTFTFEESGNCITEKFALSNDGQTIIFIVCSNSVFHVEQFNYNCEEGVFERVSSFPFSSLAKSEVTDVKLGGSCSEKLFIVTRNALTDHVVEVHSRLPVTSSGCCKKPATGCCKNLRNFSVDTLVTVIENVSQNTNLFDRFGTLVADPIDGNSFIFVETMPCLNNFDAPYFESPIFVRLWRQSGDPTVWCKCDLNNDFIFPSNRCYVPKEFDVMSFDNSCNKFCYAIGQRMMTVRLSQSFLNFFVSDPDGDFYVNVTRVGPTTEEIYFRVEGDTEYTYFDSAVSKQKITLNEKTCKAKTIEVLAVQGPAPVNPIANPDLIIRQAFLPLRTCFNVICFEKR